MNLVRFKFWSGDPEHHLPLEFLKVRRSGSLPSLRSRNRKRVVLLFKPLASRNLSVISSSHLWLRCIIQQISIIQRNLSSCFPMIGATPLVSALVTHYYIQVFCFEDRWTPWVKRIFSKGNKVSTNNTWVFPFKNTPLTLNYAGCMM